jgi:selenocysteine lyase/cysteine desulfurase
MDSMPSQAAATALARRGSFVSHGDFYATTVLDRLGLTEAGLIRVGAACYTSVAEVDRLLDDVGRLAR